MINYKLIGQRIREVRLRQSITQEALAEMVNISAIYISYIENGKRKPSLESLIGISNALGITLDELLSGNQMYNPTDYLSDLDALMAECSLQEKRFVYELARSSIDILHRNDWTI